MSVVHIDLIKPLPPPPPIGLPLLLMISVTNHSPLQSNLSTSPTSAPNPHQIQTIYLHLRYDVCVDSPVHSRIELVAEVIGSGAKVGATPAAARAFAVSDTLLKLVLECRIRSWHEDDLRVRGLGHRLHRLELADLHGRRAGEDIGGLAHQLGSLDFCPGGNDLTLSDTLALGGHGERVLELASENDILDQHALDLHTPAGCDIFDDLCDALGDLLTALNDILQDTGTNDMAKSGLGAFNKRLADVDDTEGGLVGGDDVVVDDGGKMDGDIVLGHTDLLGDFAYLDFDIDRDETF